MKLRYLAYFVSLLFYYSCEKEADSKGSFEIPLNECKEKKFDGETIRLCLDNIQESRCPSMANCVWAGYAKASFTLKLKGQDIPFELSTITMLPTLRRDTTVLGYKIKLVNIFPYPERTDDAIENYTAEVEVTRQ